MKRVFLEDGLREQQDKKKVGSLDNFDKLWILEGYEFRLKYDYN